MTAAEVYRVDTDEPVESTPIDELPEVLDTYDGMTAGQLAQECVGRSLSNTGGKKVLIERLREDDEKPFS